MGGTETESEIHLLTVGSCGHQECGAYGEQKSNFFQVRPLSGR